jgi:hypothetical protein
MFATRRRLLAVPGCLADPVIQGQEYLTRAACGSGIEAIGQARAVKYLSDHLETPSQGLISPNVQWEVSLGAVARPDIFVYNRFFSPLPGVRPIDGVHIIEAKVKNENPKYDEWRDQVTKQVRSRT